MSSSASTQQVRLTSERSQKKTELLVKLKNEVLTLREQLEAEKLARSSINDWLQSTLRPNLDKMNDGFMKQQAQLKEELLQEKQKNDNLINWIKKTLGPNRELLETFIEQKVSARYDNHPSLTEDQELITRWQNEITALNNSWRQKLEEISSKSQEDLSKLESAWKKEREELESRIQTEKSDFESRIQAERDYSQHQIEESERNWEIERRVWVAERELLTNRLQLLGSLNCQLQAEFVANGNKHRPDEIFRAKEWLCLNGCDGHVGSLFKLGYDSLQSLALLEEEDLPFLPPSKRKELLRAAEKLKK